HMLLHYEHQESENRMPLIQQKWVKVCGIFAICWGESRYGVVYSRKKIHER
nr:hypothetical protein [Tanacetum cinerariifolium]